MMTSRSQEEWSGWLEQAEYDLANINTTAKPWTSKSPNWDANTIASSIDHTLLKLDATGSQIDDMCAEARRYRFKSVCVRINWVQRAVHNLQGTAVLVACVIGFHEGTYPTREKQLCGSISVIPLGDANFKSREAKVAVEGGAMELDMVINHVWLREKRYQGVCDDIAAVRSVAPQPVGLKVILETSVLSREDIIAGCKLAEAAGADFVKTSTGFHGQGATVENVKLMRSVVGHHMKVKASGGVRTRKDLEAMIEAGADRIGASSGVAIMNETVIQ